MQEVVDSTLLREYVAHGSEEAFATLVRRHINKVYSIALRHTRNLHQAEEITQAVFVILAQKSRHLSRGVVLSGWLYQTARFAAVTFIRSEIRRARREQEAHMQRSLNEPEPDVWSQIAPLLDTAMAGLSETDRHAVVLRFFDGKSMREVGIALGASEDAAKMRVSRAVEKLRLFFGRRGIVVPGAVLTGTIAANAVQAAPASLARTATSLALAQGATASGATLTLIKGALKLTAWTKAKTTVLVGAGLLLAAGIAVSLWHFPFFGSRGEAKGITPKIAAGGASFGGNLWVLTPDGRLWAMGDNWPVDPIGDGTSEPRPRQVRIRADRDWVDVAAGVNFALALKQDGSLWAWGGNNYGQLGDGTAQSRNRPVRIGGDHDWAKIAAGAFYGLALKSDGTLWAWGENDAGQLGIGTTQPQSVPVQVGRDRDWKSVSGSSHTLALKTDGTLWAWGLNANGLLGNGSGGTTPQDFNSFNRSVPVQIGTEKDWVAVSAGQNHSVALKADGTLWSWGASFYGELGDGTKGRSFTPERIGDSGDWKMAEAGDNHTLALKTDGSLWAWGFNTKGQVGNGTTQDQLVPVRIGRANDGVQVWGGILCSLALKADGSLWVWGDQLVQRKSQPSPWLQRMMIRFKIPIKRPPPSTPQLVPVKLAELGPVRPVPKK